MKKVMFALCFMFGGVVVLSAQDTTSTQYRTESQWENPQDAQAQQDQQDRERIQSTELPEEVKRTLEGEEYRGWLVSGAFKAKAQTGVESESGVTGQENTDPNAPSNAATQTDEEIYIVELKNGAETKTLRFDQEGNELEGMDDSQFNQDNQAMPGQYPDTPPSTPPTPDNRYNQPDPNEDPVTPTEPIEPTEPSQPDQTLDQPDQSLDTETDHPADHTEIQTPDQSTETESSQSTQPDQSRTDEPK